MSQHDYVLDNNTGAAVRADINSALSAIVTQNSGSFKPDTTYPLQIWADTTNTSKILIKQRSLANNSWATLYHLQGDMSYPVIYRIKNYTGDTEVAEYDLFGNYRLGLSPRSGALTSTIENTDSNTGAKVAQVLSTNAGTITLNKNCLIDGGKGELTNMGGTLEIGTGSAHPVTVKVNNTTVITYSEAAATLGNMTASVSRNSALAYTISNTNAGTNVNSNMNLQSNAGSLNLSKYSTASGLLGGASIYNSGGSLFFGTTDAGALTFVTNSAQAAGLDSNGNFLLNKATGGLGYGVGAGGTVTQTTSKSTAVTLNRPCGQITLHSASLAAGAAVSFALNNSLQVSGYDHWTASVPFFTGYRVKLTANSAGLLTFTLTNETASALAEAVTINFNLTKGSNA